MSTWIDIAKIIQGKNVPKSKFDAVIDDLTWLKNAIGGAGAVEGIVNGSFESDADADGRPDGWTWTASGGSIAIESTAPGHGAKALKITSSGSGGGNVVHDDYILCCPNRSIRLAFLHWSTDAGLSDKVELLWYDKAKSYLSASVIYTDDTTNPTSATLFIRGTTPPANAMFCRPKITGANDTTAGSSYWDGFEVVDFTDTPMPWTTAEVTVTTTSYSTLTTFAVYIPRGAISLILEGEGKHDGTNGYVRLAIGSTYSNEASLNLNAYAACTNTIDVSALGGTIVTVEVQGKIAPSGNVYYRLLTTMWSSRFV